MDRIQEYQVPEWHGDVEWDEQEDDFDDYPADMPLDFVEHPYIRDEKPYDPEDSYVIEREE